MCFGVILAIASFVRAGEVIKTDETVVAGDVISLDADNLTVQPPGGLPMTIPLAEISRIRIAPPAASSTDSRAPRGLVPSNGDVAANRPDLIPAPAAPVSLPLMWRLTLDSGDVLSGIFRSWSDDKFVLELQQGRAILQVPIANIREIWRVAPDLVSKARGLKIDQGNEDIAYVIKDSDVVAVKGAAIGVQNLSLGFIYESQQRKINIDRLLGVLLASQKHATTTPTAGFNALFRFPNGDQLNGQWTGVKDGFALLKTSWDQAVLLPLPSIGTIELHNGRVVYLSDLKPARVEQTPYFDRIIPWRADVSLDGGPLRLNDGQQYAHGLAMHSRCVLEYDLGGKFDQFQARLGFEPLPAGAPIGRVAARVLVDGIAKFEMPDLRSDQQPLNVKVDVHDGKRLTLEVDFGQDQDVNDRIVWANARLLRSDVAKQN